MKSLMTTIFTAAIFLASITAAAAQARCSVWEKDSRKGEQWQIHSGKGFSWVGSRWNDRISSIWVPKGHTIVLYTDRDYRGRSEVFTATGKTNGYINLRNWNFNDAVSSLKCLPQ